MDQSKQLAHNMTLEMEELQARAEEAQTNLERETEIINAQNEELQELEALHKSKSSDLVELKLEIQKINHEMERHQKEQQTTHQIVDDLEKQHPWIADQKQ